MLSIPVYMTWKIFLNDLVEKSRDFLILRTIYHIIWKQKELENMRLLCWKIERLIQNLNIEIIKKLIEKLKYNKAGSIIIGKIVI